MRRQSWQSAYRPDGRLPDGKAVTRSVWKLAERLLATHPGAFTYAHPLPIARGAAFTMAAFTMADILDGHPDDTAGGVRTFTATMIAIVCNDQTTANGRQPRAMFGWRRFWNDFQFGHRRGLGPCRFQAVVLDGRTRFPSKCRAVPRRWACAALSDCRCAVTRHRPLLPPLRQLACRPRSHVRLRLP